MDYAIIVDGNSLIYRAYYATQKGKDDEKIFKEFFETLSAIKRIVKKLLRENAKYRYGIVVFDTSRDTFRRDKFDEYKSNRKSMPIPLFSNLDKIKQIFIDEGLAIVNAPESYEGDDAIATLSSIFSRSKICSHIFSADRDLLQLVSNFVSVFLFRLGKCEKYTIENFATLNNGLMPYQIPHYKALSGDSSDNYKGIKGIGPITSRNWLQKYGTIDKIYKNIDELKPMHKRVLLDNQDKVFLFLELSSLVKDLELSSNLEKYELVHKNEADSRTG